MERFFKKNINKINLILVILMGIIPLIFSFNSSLWFDEAYSVGLVRQNWGNLVISGINDVHPILYYVILKLYSLIFGTSVIALRIFSIIPIVLLGVFSFTKIRKEFGEKISFYFNLLLTIIPIFMHYGSQIRMYSLSMFFVTITAFYAYRAYKYNTKKDWIIFVVFSLCSAYTHYFALFTIGIINIVLLYYIIKQSKIKEIGKTQEAEAEVEEETEKEEIAGKEEKGPKETSKSEIPSKQESEELKSEKANLKKLKPEKLKRWIKFAIIQVLIYIPGALVFLMQSTRVAGGFWISVKYPDIFGQIMSFFFTDIIDSGMPSIFALFVTVYAGLKLHRIYVEEAQENPIKNIQKNSNAKIALISLAVVGLVILITLAISLIRAIFIPRYMIPMVGLILFSLAFVLSTEKSKIIKGIIVVGLIILSIFNGITLFKKSYSADNNKPIEFISSEVQQEDIFIYTNIGPSSSVALDFPNNKQYFYNKDHWTVEKAYGAFAPQMKTIENIDFLDDFTGRIWVIDKGNSDMYNILKDLYSNTSSNENEANQTKKDNDSNEPKAGQAKNESSANESEAGEKYKIIIDREKFNAPFSGDVYEISLFEKIK